MASAGEVWFVDFGAPYPGEPAAQRPAVVLGPPESFGQGFPYCLLAPMTRTNRGLWLHVEVKPSDGSGLSHVSYVQCELLRSVNADRLLGQLGRLDGWTFAEVDDVTRVLLAH